MCRQSRLPHGPSATVCSATKMRVPSCVRHHSHDIAWRLALRTAGDGHEAQAPLVGPHEQLIGGRGDRHRGLGPRGHHGRHRGQPQPLGHPDGAHLHRADHTGARAAHLAEPTARFRTRQPGVSTVLQASSSAVWSRRDCWSSPAAEGIICGQILPVATSSTGLGSDRCGMAHYLRCGCGGSVLALAEVSRCATASCILSDLANALEHLRAAHGS